jgi:hypothetical protein
VEVLAYAVPFVAFLALYALLYKRAAPQRRVQWGWLAAIVLCAGVALLIGAVA